MAAGEEVGGGAEEESAVRTASAVNAAAVAVAVGVAVAVAVLGALNRNLSRYRNRRLPHHLRLNQER